MISEPRYFEVPGSYKEKSGCNPIGHILGHLTSVCEIPYNSVTPLIPDKGYEEPDGRRYTKKAAGSGRG